VTGTDPAERITETMKYLLLLYSEPNAGPAPGTPEQAAEMQEWWAYTDALATAGVLLGGEALQGTETATTLTSRTGSVVTTDGPFTETKEVLGGFYLIDAENLDAAMKWAERCPIMTYGSVEIRPVMEFSRDDDEGGSAPS
jgi:hypothetical protein